MNTAATSRPVVVGYDHSETAVAALDWAGQLAERSGASITVVYASEAIVYAQDVSYGFMKPDHEHERAEQIAQKGVDHLSARHPELAIEAVGSILSATVALDEASTSASVIVVGSHGRGRVNSIMLGSTAYALSGHARCPVIVVRDGHAAMPGPGRPVVVGSDGSKSARHAVDAAASVAQQWDATLLVVSSWTPPPPDPWGNPPSGYSSVADALKAREDKARDVNQDGVDHIRLEHPNLVIEGLVMEARPEDAVMNASSDAAMLVVGSRGRTKFIGTFLGSTARAVLHQSTIPVMVAQ